jgi:hypothetical protein
MRGTTSSWQRRGKEEGRMWKRKEICNGRENSNYYLWLAFNIFLLLRQVKKGKRYTTKNISLLCSSKLHVQEHEQPKGRSKE